MFAIIDIETCGGKFEFREGRITEICILIHDGLQVVDKFSTLINPECHISPLYTNITGITNRMVADAPKFQEVARKIWDLTEGKIFIAHNVGFDYGFIKDEFKSLGAKFKRETLCTVRLSRKLLPGKTSYSLGRLCDSLGIDNSARHRAEGDAVATAKLFDLLLHVKSMHPVYKNKGVDELMTTRIDKIKKYILDKIPEECGVYYFLDKDQNIIYVGKSVNMYARAISHFNTSEQKGKKMLNDLYNVDFVSTGSELIALLLESQEIKKHQPKYNRLRKADIFTHCIDWHKNEKGIVNFSVVPYEESKNGLLSFNNQGAARERLENWIDQASLCLRYCGLTDKDSICMNHQIKKCNGICGEKEDINAYNKRAFEVIEKHMYYNPNFALVDQGRSHGEKAIILVENGYYSGYGYFDTSQQIKSALEFKNLIKKADYYPDSDNLIRSWIKKGGNKEIIRF
ncbi:MAG: exonuclease domain-containing protein [Bacteroidota bacterium]|nr:exonuclease domain-containing protein [Bacteroidota bacterium]